MGCSDVCGPLWKLITAISSHAASFCGELKEKWQRQIGFTCTMFHPHIVALSGEIHFILKDFKSKASVGRIQSRGIVSFVSDSIVT